MFCTCNYAYYMSRMIQIRNIPDALHRSLKSRAALAGMSLSDYLLAEIREIAALPTPHELQERLAQRRRVKLPVSAAAAIRAERDAR
jgi:plasmid stability protein